MQGFIQVITAIDSKEAAQRIANNVVERRLAASCWVAGPITSTHWWNGNIEQLEEWVCQIRTRKELFEQVEAAIKELHTYEEPGIIILPIIGGSQSYLNWIEAETTK